MSVEAYHRQIQAAREVGLGLTRSQAEAYRLILEAYAEELAAVISSGFSTIDQRRTLAAVTEILEQMVRDLARSTRQGVVLTLDRIVGLQTAATLELMAAQGSALSVSFGGLGVATAQSWLARPELSRAFKTIRRDAIRQADHIIASALVRGASSTELARQLRSSIIGSEGLPTDILVDRRRISYAVIRRMGMQPTPENLRTVRRQGSKVAMRAQLIARTEIMGAQHEIGARLAVASPVVEAIEWFLSHRHVVPDTCDVLAKADLFGLGPGFFPPERLPSRPHPRCMCGHRHKLRPSSEWGTPRPPAPNLNGDPQLFVDALGLPPSQGRQLRAALNAGRRKPLKVVPDPGQSLVKAIAKRENEIRALDVEWLSAWDPKTGDMLINRTDNAARSVGVPKEQLPLLRNAVVTHNHPGGSSFSNSDIGTAIQFNLAEIRAVGREYDYALKRPDTGWPDQTQVLATARRVLREIASEQLIRAARGEISSRQAGQVISHQMWVSTFAEFGMGHLYTRTERSRK